jgi:AraC-like DNA-binding protein
MVLHVLGAAERAGVDVRGLASRLGLPTSPRFEERIELGRLIELWEAVVALSGDPGLPARVATYPGHAERSLLAFLNQVQPTVGAVVETLLRYWPTVTDAFSWTLERTKTTFSLVAAPAGPIERAGWRHQLEFEVADIVHSGLRIMGPAARPRRVALAHRPPPSLDAYVAVMGLEPEFSSPRVEITYPHEVWDLPMPGNKPELARVLEAQLAAMLERPDARRKTADRAREIIASVLREGRPDGDEIARRLGLGRRTLERRLVDEGTSLRKLVDEERFALAAEWLGDVEIAQISARLGYSDVRAFDRAFRRWAGMTPSDFRRRRAGEGGPE